MVQATKVSRAKRSTARLFGGVLLAGLSVMTAAPAFGQAQPGGAGGAGGAGGRGNRGNFDPTQARQQMNDRLKELLAASDDEWKVLQPKIEKVQEYQRASAGRGGMGLLMGRGGQGAGGAGGGGRRGGGAGGAGGAAQAQTPVSQKAQELAAAVENKEAKPDEYKAKLAAYRDAVAQNKANLQKAQGELKELVTVRQEAVLVAVGYLE